MIIAKTPLRITLGGGGTDLPFYYRKKNGFCVAASIQKYTYVTLSNTFYDYFILKYSRTEKVKTVEKIKHVIFREIYKHFQIKGYLEATSLADIPSGTGMGSSASFIISLCLALSKKLNRSIDVKKIVEMACNKEMEINNFTTGKQDQYGVAYPGINAFTFYKNDKVKIQKIKLSLKMRNKFENRFLLVYSNKTRSAKKILSYQKKNFQINKNIISHYDALKKLGYDSYKALQKNDLDTVGDILNFQSTIKNNLNKSNIIKPIEEIKKSCLLNGAQAGRVLGAGGGGFIIFYTKDREKFTRFLKKKKLKIINIKLENKGPHLLS